MGHTDLLGLGGFTVDAATVEEILVLAQETDDGTVHLLNSSGEFPDCKVCAIACSALRCGARVRLLLASAPDPLAAANLSLSRACSLPCCAVFCVRGAGRGAQPVAVRQPAVGPRRLEQVSKSFIRSGLHGSLNLPPLCSGCWLQLCERRAGANAV